MSNKIEFNLIKVLNIFGIDFYNGAISVRELIEIMDVAEFNPWESPLKGYQRKLNDAKVNAIAERTILNLDSPEALVDAINLNIREKDAVAYIKPLDKKNDRYGGFHTLTYIPTLGKAFLVDGQHRARGLQAAVSKLRDDKKFHEMNQLLDTYINICLTLTEDIYKEAYTFYLINQYAKNVSPEGATRLMLEGFENSSIEFQNEVTSENTKTTIDDIHSAKIADMLSANSLVWANRIKDYNEKGAGKVSIRAMAMMIKPLFLVVSKALKEAGSKQNPIDVTYELIEIYWKSISKIFPDMFNQIKGKNFGITKSSQAEVMMKVLRYIFLVHDGEWKQRGYTFGDMKKDESWDKVLITLRKFKDENGSLPPRKVTGQDCWTIGTSGSMGKYTSASAKINIAKILAEHIENELKISRNNPGSLI